MVDAPPTAVGVRPVDRRGSLVGRPRLRTRALDELEANGGAQSRGCPGTAALHARHLRVGPTTVATISHLWRDGAAPRVARGPLPTRRAQVFDRVWKQRTGSNFKGSKVRFFRSRSNRCIFTFSCRIFVPIHICLLSQPTLSTRYCRFAPAWNRPEPRPLSKNTTSESLQPVLTLRFPCAGGVAQGDFIHAQNAPSHCAEMRDE